MSRHRHGKSHRTDASPSPQAAQFVARADAERMDEQRIDSALSAAKQTIPLEEVAIERGRLNVDGWGNFFSGLNQSGKDPRLNTTLQGTDPLQENDLNDLYRSDGIGTRVVDVLAEDMTREWFTITGDTDNAMEAELRKFKGKAQIIRCVKWASLHGGAVGVLGIDDGGKYEDEVREDGIRKITHIHVFDRWRALWTTMDLYQDPENEKYGQPEFYRIYPIGVLAQTPFRVHESRILRFEGKDVPERLRIMNQRWGDSDLQDIYDRLRGLAESYAGLESAMREYVIGTLTVKNLMNLIATKKEGQVLQRVQLMDMCRRWMKTVLLDQDESYARLGIPLEGFPEALRELTGLVSAVKGIPESRLWGRSAKGLNADDDVSLRGYYDHVSALQQERLDEPLSKLCRYVMLSKESAFKGKELDDWKVEFSPLYQMDPKEEAQIRLWVAQADHIYVQDGVLTPEEVADSRFNGEYSIETKLGFERNTALTLEDKAAEEAERLVQAGQGGPNAPGTGQPPDKGFGANSNMGALTDTTGQPQPRGVTPPNANMGGRGTGETMVG